MSFKSKHCKIPTVYCGKKDEMPTTSTNNSVYTEKGTPYTCLRKGVGFGMNEEKKKHLLKYSLQHIPYIGPIYDDNFINLDIKSTAQLLKYAKSHTKEEIEELLDAVFTKSNSVIDRKAYNSTLMYLYEHGINDKKLPTCIKMF